MPAPVSSLVSNVTDSLFNFTLSGLVQIIAEACTFTAFIFGVIYVFFIIPKFLNSIFFKFALFKMFIKILFKMSSIFDAIQHKIVPKSDELERILLRIMV